MLTNALILTIVIKKSKYQLHSRVAYIENFNF